MGYHMGTVQASRSPTTRVQTTWAPALRVHWRLLKVLETRACPKPSAGSCMDVAHFLPGLSQLLCGAWSQVRFSMAPSLPVSLARCESFCGVNMEPGPACRTLAPPFLAGNFILFFNT